MSITPVDIMRVKADTAHKLSKFTSGRRNDIERDLSDDDVRNIRAHRVMVELRLITDEVQKHIEAPDSEERHDALLELAAQYDTTLAYYIAYTTNTNPL